MRQPFALAVQGSWPDAGIEATEPGLNDPENVRIVSKFLKDHGLKVEAPLITEAYQADLEGSGRTERLICAHSDLKALRDDQPGAVYALALLHTPAPQEKTIVLAGQYSYKPAGQSIEEHRRYHGPRDFYRFIAFHDIDGDGRKEIVLYRAKEDATQVDVFIFDGRRARHVLTAYKPSYN